VPVPPEKYTVTKNGTTYLSDLYYIKCEDNPPVMDQDFNGGPLVLNGQTFAKGLGCKGKSQVIYKLNGKAARFQALVGLTDHSSTNQPGEFSIQVEDRFGGKNIFTSGKMRKGDQPVAVDVDVTGLDAILLEFSGKETFGNWADVRVISN